MTLGRELAHRASPTSARCGSWPTTRAAMTFLIADGVVPSNEDRGYVLRRIMRRAMQQGHRIGIEHGFLPQYVEPSSSTDGRRATPSCCAQHETIAQVGARRGGELRPHARAGHELLDDLARAPARSSGADAFRLHDTYGFPIELTREIAAERGVAVRRARPTSSA